MNKLILIICIILFCNSYAYLGMGPLIPAIGSAIMFLFVIILAVLEFFFYPIKKFLNKKRKKEIKEINNIENRKIKLGFFLF